MYEKLSMIKNIALNEAVKIASEISSEACKMDIKRHAQALDDLKDAVKVVHMIDEIEEEEEDEKEKHMGTMK